jgi:hypothetical protein
MFGKKKHSWFWYAFWSLLSACIIYWVARLFLRSSEKAAAVSRSEKKKTDRKDTEPVALFI